MKVAFHFDADYKSFGGYYGWPINRTFFNAILRSTTLEIHSKLFLGDLLLDYLAHDEKPTKNGRTIRFNKERYEHIVSAWLNPENPVWMKFREDIIEKIFSHNIYVLCLESIRLKDAEYLHTILSPENYYLGALEVDDESPVHWAGYSHSLIPKYRIIGKVLHVFWDGINEDSKDEGEMKELKSFGFMKVDYESLNGKFTIFDKYHNYEHAKRIASWKRLAGDTLAFVADNIVSRLSDSAPELSNKLWSTLRTFERAEINEEFAQVMASCRRIIEYVSDCLFPPAEEEQNGMKFNKQQYRNRLLAFADRSRKSNTNIDLICISTQALAEQLEKLSSLANKGVHSEVYKAETRRCLIRTIMLLDDIASLRLGAFEIKDHLDEEEIRRMILGENNKQA